MCVCVDFRCCCFCFFFFRCHLFSLHCCCWTLLSMPSDYYMHKCVRVFDSGLFWSVVFKSLVHDCSSCSVCPFSTKNRFCSPIESNTKWISLFFFAVASYTHHQQRYLLDLRPVAGGDMGSESITEIDKNLFIPHSLSTFVRHPRKMVFLWLLSSYVLHLFVYYVWSNRLLVNFLSIDIVLLWIRKYWIRLSLIFRKCCERLPEWNAVFCVLFTYCWNHL